MKAFVLACALALGACATSDTATLAYCEQVAREVRDASANWPNLTAERQRQVIRLRDESRAKCGSAP